MQYAESSRNRPVLRRLSLLVFLLCVSFLLFSCDTEESGNAGDAECILYSVPHPLPVGDILNPFPEFTQAERTEIEKAMVIAEKKAEEERIAAEKAERIARLTGYSESFVSTLTEEEQKQAQALREEGFVFYRQNWSVLKNLAYGDIDFGQCGCGPTVVAEVIANLAGVPVTPLDTWQIANDMNAYLMPSGTSYYFMTSVPARYGIKATNISMYDKEVVFAALREGKLVLITMGPGDFTLGAHFMLLRGITEDGKILIADSYSFEYTVMEWEYDYLFAQIKTGYWIFEKEETLTESVGDTMNTQTEDK